MRQYLTLLGGKNSWGRSTLEREPHTCYGVCDKEKPRLKQSWFNSTLTGYRRFSGEYSWKVPTRLENWEKDWSHLPGQHEGKAEGRRAWLLWATGLFCSWAPWLDRNPAAAGVVRIKPAKAVRARAGGMQVPLATGAGTPECKLALDKGMTVIQRCFYSVLFFFKKTSIIHSFIHLTYRNCDLIMWTRRAYHPMGNTDKATGTQDAKSRD